MGHTYHGLLYHTVFSTKSRRRTIQEQFRQGLWEYMGGIVRNEFGRTLLIGGTDDHVHCLLSIRPAVAVSDAMRKLKTLSSRWVHESCNELDFEWQEGYSVFSVSKSNQSAVESYISNQQEHHCRRTFEEELVALLERHEIDYDRKYVFD